MLSIKKLCKYVKKIAPLLKCRNLFSIFLFLKKEGMNGKMKINFLLQSKQNAFHFLSTNAISGE